MLFDFIPFAFWGDREVFFINDNFSLKQMATTNQTLEKLVRTETSDSANKDARKALFKTIQKTADFLNYSVEVITARYRIFRDNVCEKREHQSPEKTESI